MVNKFNENPLSYRKGGFRMPKLLKKCSKSKTFIVSLITEEEVIELQLF